MWNEPYLESCCRSALHRLKLSGQAGRPAGVGDAPCLHRLEGMGLASSSGDDQRYTITTQGHARHRTEILKQPT
ncbi:hypothetical protein CFR78_01900 [Komagataeibacter rhaeticus]|uniref:Uncharacterized protein n=1 Tax=Komagataeibacter rhaeticus TaxID=215221 RepID=A0A181C745_9PROT|nr:hypothetical protein [Komagataeibacter rhaeticus]ATU73732.1 hypothetical protein CT154_13875 [Komagataeibacter xylinus]KDU94921.1 hypothetical protein GLUCORHAEAF1_11610 [Komagataeibacter rhaeticus AF1]MBL7239836.1 hypothetical protein [Komagataeibacter rhaeticus]MDT8870701.1 hypothetical protein [Komagataeibacter rhaeticus]PYD55166.1 hypothetical protein CFR78_01900 [Komagataeibacter rhaeticus]